MASIEKFVSTFYGATHEYVHQLDPFSTFSFKLKFYPCKTGGDGNNGFIDKLLSTVANAAANAAGNALNNATGGLAAAIGGMADDGIKKQHSKYSNSGIYSFIDYLGVATHLDKGEGFMDSLKGAIGMSASPSGMPQLDLSEFVQEAVVPNMSMQIEEAQSLLGKFQANGSFIMPDVNELQLTILNTKLPILEYIFYPWMREVTLPYWSYDTQPYTTATATIDFSKHADIQYRFFGCRPKNIQPLQPSNQVDGNALRRQVTLVFDYMLVTSKDMDTQPSALDLLLDTGKELAGGAAGMFGI